MSGFISLAEKFMEDIACFQKCGISKASISNGNGSVEIKTNMIEGEEHKKADQICFDLISAVREVKSSKRKELIVVRSACAGIIIYSENAYEKEQLDEGQTICSIQTLMGDECVLAPTKGRLIRIIYHSGEAVSFGAPILLWENIGADADEYRFRLSRSGQSIQRDDR